MAKRTTAKKHGLVRLLRSEADYDRALAEIEPYFEKEPKSGTSAADRFDLFALLIEDYENKHWLIEPPDPVAAIRWRMNTSGYTQADLGRLIGSRQRASDVLSCKRRLTMGMAWKLHRQMGHSRRSTDPSTIAAATGRGAIVGGAIQASSGTMPFCANSFFALSFLVRCVRRIPRSTFGALVNWMLS
jgi:HTH-type transcriptional regulator/antitoxin HigA